MSNLNAVRAASVLISLMLTFALAAPVFTAAARIMLA
jgi:hypothetical protein